LRRLPVLRLTHLIRLAGDIQTVLETRGVERHQHLPFRDELVGQHFEAVDHAFDRGTDQDRLLRNDLGRRQNGLAHGHPGQPEQQCQHQEPQLSLTPEQPVPPFGPAFLQRRPRMGIGVAEIAEEMTVVVAPGFIPDQKQAAQPLFFRAVEGNPQAVGRQPVHPFDSQSRRHLPGIDGLDLAAGADRFQNLPQPHQERRVGIRQSDTGNRHHLPLAGSRRPAP
jgi:hypothetical protein